MPNIEDKKRILTALGWKVARYGESSSGCTLINPEGYYWPLGINPTLYRSESAAWNSVVIDANFVFANIVPFMNKKGGYLILTVEEDGHCHAEFNLYVEIKDAYKGDGPTVEAAIQEAFISYLKEQERV